jgi:hypothetical protein
MVPASGNAAHFNVGICFCDGPRSFITLRPMIGKQFPTLDRGLLDIRPQTHHAELVAADALHMIAAMSSLNVSATARARIRYFPDCLFGGEPLIQKHILVSIILSASLALMPLSGMVVALRKSAKASELGTCIGARICLNRTSPAAWRKTPTEVRYAAQCGSQGQIVIPNIR